MTEAHNLYNRAFLLGKSNPDSAELSALSARAWELVAQALSIAYPVSFREDCERLQRRDAAGLEGAIRFLEADPMFFRTGYVKAKIIRTLKPQMLTQDDTARLQRIVLHVVDTRDDRDFRAFCRLARKADGQALRAGLEARQASPDPNVRRRAQWVRDALRQKDQQEKGKVWTRKA